MRHAWRDPLPRAILQPVPHPTTPTLARVAAYYTSTLNTFVHEPVASVLGELTQHSDFDVEISQRNAWTATVVLLQEALLGIQGRLFLEFEVPRLGSRIDAVVVSGPAILPIEMKLGASSFVAEHRNQAWDYALDLRNFHEGSHRAPIFPILVATAASHSDAAWQQPHADLVWPPFHSGAADLRRAIVAALALADGPDLEPDTWGRARYQPTPTIIEAARALFAMHDVAAITRSDAGAQNLGATSATVEHIIEHARRQGRKAIVFVTGVPGAGKTLVGLKVATTRRDRDQAGHAVFLSGNGPLVAVLREALTRDAVTRARVAGVRLRKAEAGQPVKGFIQNVHHFRDEGLRDHLPPVDHVVIFDEAQRAWNREKTARFMSQRKNRHDFDSSEPEFLLSYMDRHQDWAVVICLVGGGQEIHDGEAGIVAWLDAIREKFPHWSAYLSNRLTDSEYAAGDPLGVLGPGVQAVASPSLHLATSMRSFRSEKLSAFVKAVLDCDIATAQSLLAALTGRYHIALTRDLGIARRWIRKAARGSESFGLVASSQAMRLKPHAIDVRLSVDPVQWFLGDRDDTRSCFYLEDAATEFQVQGLELDWTCVTWDADLRYAGKRWSHHAFRGKAWTSIRKPERQRYLLNAYRVLLTRARQGMVLVVPPGDRDDRTRDPALYDATYSFLAEVGIPTLT